MFESILAEAEQCSEKIGWRPVMPGVAVCEFNSTFTAVCPPALLPGHYETLFCQGGTLYLHTAAGHGCCVQKGDILLVSDLSQVQSLSFSSGCFQGIVVAVHAAEARDSLAQLCALLGQLELDVRQVGRLMHASSGCVCIHGELWSEALFLVLAGLPAGERGRYCTLKTVELLYLLCRDGFDLSRTWLEHCEDRCQVELVRQVNDYIQTHLAENLTIDRLAKRFHCSPTALKLSFHQSYGVPIHHCISTWRLRRGAELLDTTTFSVLQVASEVGYSSTSQFSAMFKRRYQLSPSQYRNRGKKSETGDNFV